METMQDSGGLLDGSRGSVAPGLPIPKTVNQLKIVESGNESGKLLTATKSMEMDPYKELELYLARVNVRVFFFFLFFYTRLLSAKTLSHHQFENLCNVR